MIRRHRQEEEAEINLTPMLDVTFIMLIFFIVTTSFVREAGLEVKKPTALTTEVKTRGSIMIAIRNNNEVWMQKESIPVERVRAIVEQAKAENPEGSVVIVADRDSDVGTFVKVMDQIKLAGVEDIAIAADEPSGG